MPYEPLIYVDEGGEVFAAPRSNPDYGKPGARRFVSFRRGAAEPGQRYGGLRVQVALVREPGYSAQRAPLINGSQAAFEVFRLEIGDDPQEGFYVLLLDVRHKVLGVYEAHRGTMHTVEVHPADIFRPALVAGASAIILVHNHPSGDPKPSREDHALTTRMQSAAALLGIPLLDHLVMGGAGYFSFADEQLL